ncbi:MAG TPA: PorV/PorQ family protein [Elusimicrobiota bacterium]|nr:PorV/PorQ family protein [Elusimicrobiota bacterium]
MSSWRVSPLLTGAVLALMLGRLPVYASSGTEGASFLDIPVGADPAALGSAYTALANDAYAPTWNPAGLGFVPDTQLAGQHLAYLDSIHYEYLSFVRPIKNSDGETVRGFGFSAQYLGSGDIAGTDVYGNSTGNFSTHYGSYNIAYGQAIGDKLSLGMTGKWINAQIDDVSANAYAVDFGSIYKMNEHLRLAATLTNLGSKLTFLSSGDSLPLSFHLGGAYTLNPQWMFAAEGVYAGTGLASFHAGSEWRPIESVSLRVGYKTDTLDGLSPIAGLTVGMGLHLWGQELAYAWAPYGDLGSAQYFSLLARFGANTEEKRNLIEYQDIKTHRSVQQQDKSNEPEYQQLMQLLSDTDPRVAESPH